MKRTILATLSGAVLACALILSCSDSPSGADAQVACDCPEAEPPLSGRIVQFDETIALPAEGNALATALCGEGGIILGGGCTTENGAMPITVSYGAPQQAPEAFNCGWNNPTLQATNGIATAICLMPPTSN